MRSPQGTNLESRRAEAALRESQSMLQLVLDTIPARVFWKDRRSVYLGCNGIFARDAGLATPEEIVGKTDYDLAWKQEEADFFRECDRRVMETDRPEYHIIEPQLQADGKQAWLDTNKIPLHDAEGNVVGILGTYEDITQRVRAEEENKRLEAQMQHAQKLESLGVLAGGIAHDFNNLLVGVLGNAGLALLELPSASPARQTIRRIETAAQRAAELTRQMLAYSGKGKFVVESLDLSKLVEEMAHLLRVSVSKKAILRFNLADHLPAIHADATQIRQVVMNLITNASDALGPRSGVVVVNTGVTYADRAYLSATPTHDELPAGYYVYVEVTDTGCGMDADTLTRIFDPFFTTKFSGRGLGLSAVLGIVRGHHGALKVDSAPGRGTTFRVLFPRSEAPESSGEAATGEKSTTGPDWRGTGTLLVVDDEEAVRIVAKMTLERFGFSVLTAGDGQEALECFRAHAGEITAVLLDMTMPKMSGEEVFQELRRIRPDIPIILSSGYDEEDAVSLFTGQKLAGFVQKPYRPMELLEKVRTVLQF